MGTLPIFVLMTLAVLFGILVMVVTRFLGTKKPSAKKLAPYECGIREIEAPEQRFPVKYLLTGMLFIAFDIEIVSFYPLAILLRKFRASPRLADLMIVQLRSGRPTVTLYGNRDSDG